MSRSTRAVLFSLVFPPDGVSTAQLLGEIAADLSESGIDVEVITSRPHYNVDASAASQQPITWKWHRLYGTSHLGKVRVTHLNMPAKAEGIPGRLLQWGWFHLGSLLLGARRKADVAMTVSPPPSVALVCALLRWFGGPRFVYCVWELYPDILVSLGKIGPNSRLLGPLKVLERLTYRTADRICVLHEGMKDAVIQEFPAAAGKVQVIPTFADTSFLAPLASNTNLRSDFELGDRFVSGYAGNLGPAQDLGLLIEAAAQLGDYGDLAWLICGDGHDRERLELMATAAGLQNMHFTGHLPYESVPEIYATFDLSVVALAEGIGHEALPSKVYRTMACGRPILAIAERGSSLASLVEDHQIGYVADPTDAAQLADLVRHASSSPEEVAQRGTRARALAESEFSRASVTTRFAEMLRLLAQDGRDS